MKIVRMSKGNYGKIRAFFDLGIDGFILKGFKIMEGINGLFVSFPSQQNKDGEWFDTVHCFKETRERLNQFAVNHYNESPDTVDEVNQEQPDEAIETQTTKTSDDIPF
jgi:stage V sporulation protein G